MIPDMPSLEDSIVNAIAPDSTREVAEAAAEETKRYVKGLVEQRHVDCEVCKGKGTYEAQSPNDDEATMVAVCPIQPSPVRWDWLCRDLKARIVKPQQLCSADNRNPEGLPGAHKKCGYYITPEQLLTAFGLHTETTEESTE